MKYHHQNDKWFFNSYIIAGNLIVCWGSGIVKVVSRPCNNTENLSFCHHCQSMFLQFLDQKYYDTCLQHHLVPWWRVPKVFCLFWDSTIPHAHQSDKVYFMKRTMVFLALMFWLPHKKLFQYHDFAISSISPLYKLERLIIEKWSLSSFIRKHC